MKNLIEISCFQFSWLSYCLLKLLRVTLCIIVSSTKNKNHHFTNNNLSFTVRFDSFEDFGCYVDTNILKIRTFWYLKYWVGWLTRANMVTPSSAHNNFEMFMSFNIDLRMDSINCISISIDEQLDLNIFHLNSGTVSSSMQSDVSGFEQISISICDNRPNMHTIFNLTHDNMSFWNGTHANMKNALKLMSLNDKFSHGLKPFVLKQISSSLDFPFLAQSVKLNESKQSVACKWQFDKRSEKSKISI